MTETCNKCGTTKSSKWYRVQLIGLDEDGNAKDIYELTLCYTCRRGFGRFIRNE